MLHKRKFISRFIFANQNCCHYLKYTVFTICFKSFSAVRISMKIQIVVLNNHTESFSINLRCSQSLYLKWLKILLPIKDNLIELRQESPITYRSVNETNWQRERERKKESHAPDPAAGDESAEGGRRVLQVDVKNVQVLSSSVTSLSNAVTGKTVCCRRRQLRAAVFCLVNHFWLILMKTQWAPSHN